MSVGATAFVLAVIVGLLLAETRVSVRHEAILRARGAREATGDVYVLMSVLYPLAFLLMGAEGVWRASRSVQAAAAAASPAWWAAGVLLMVASKALKYWAIRHLKERWTFKVLVLPGAALVRTGPYRYVDHPNYIAVVGELVSTMLMMSAWLTGPVMIAAFGVVMGVRLRVEVRALSEGRPR